MTYPAIDDLKIDLTDGVLSVTLNRPDSLNSLNHPMLSGIAEGNTSREDLLGWVNDFDGEGITKQIKFDEAGEVSSVVVYAYEVKDGVIQPGTPIE